MLISTIGGVLGWVIILILSLLQIAFYVPLQRSLLSRFREGLRGNLSARIGASSLAMLALKQRCAGYCLMPPYWCGSVDLEVGES
jgi:hypothetical protein